jgi:hypothetical protein
MTTENAYVTLPRLKTFQLLVKSALEISGNKIKVKTDQQILIGNFQPKYYFSKTELKKFDYLPSKLAKMVTEADVDTNNINVKKLRDRFGKGEWRGQTPFGYKKHSDGSMRPCHKIFVVSFVFYTFIHTRSLLETRKALASLGVDLIENRILHLLENGVYCGVMTRGFEKLKLEKIFKPIVSESLFDSVQNILASNRKSRNDRVSLVTMLPLRGFVIDYDSGIGLTGNGNSANVFYRVNFGRRMKGRPFQIKTSILASIFKEHLNTHFSGRNDNSKVFFLQCHNSLRPVMLRLVEKLKKESSRSLDATESGSNRHEIFNPHTIRLQMIREQLEHLTYFQESENFIEYGTNIMASVANIWENAEYEAKRILQYLAFPNGILFNNALKKFVNDLGVIY